jgi:radical SAM protein with 4Fe4S-binding SPASM domain
MGLMLHPRMTLSKSEQGVLLHRRRRSSADPQFMLHPIRAAVLILLDGSRTVSEVSSLIAKLFSATPVQSQTMTQEVVDRFWQFLIESSELLKAGARKVPVYDLEHFLYAVPSRPLPLRWPAPASLSIDVTGYCNRRCIYCGVGAKPSRSPHDAGLSLDRLKSLVEEAADIGVADLRLTGGEPFLRPDILDFLEYADRMHFRRLRVFTKFSLNESHAAALQKIKRLRLEIGLDSADGKTADLLTGTKGYLEEMKSSIELLAAKGIDVKIQTVVTRFNYLGLHELAAFLMDLRIRSVSFLRCKKSLFGNPDTLFLDADEEQSVRSAIDAIRARECFDIVESDFDKVIPGCTRGRSSLAILPDGSASMCQGGIWGLEELRVGSLADSSLMQVWNSDPLMRMVAPARDQFAGTPCFDCDDFDMCTRSGRCYYEAKSRYGSIYAPDRACARAQGK